MLAAITDGPIVAMSFANNFWGKEDAGVGPLLERMHAAKQTNDELRSFYAARSSIEDDYARKLLSLSRKPLGSQEMGGLRASLDTVRSEVEAMAKQHQSIGAQMKSELEEPLAAFAGGMKERRKIVQNVVDKLHKSKSQQTQAVNKTRDRYEQDCLKIKGYLAQGHMVMGQEERKNKARLEKTQLSLASSNADYDAAVKALEETTARWNREWKAAADKFQDLEEERLDFTKSSLWSFANITSTVCVSDDASCEKIRLSLENMDVEKDITIFIKEKGTGQEIPDPPKYINFCRGDFEDSRSEADGDESYSVAQFPRSINPAFRTSSPQPSTYESHHDPNSALARDLAHNNGPESCDTTTGAQKRAKNAAQKNGPPRLPSPASTPTTQASAPVAACPAQPPTTTPSIPAPTQTPAETHPQMRAHATTPQQRCVVQSHYPDQQLQRQHMLVQHHPNPPETPQSCQQPQREEQPVAGAQPLAVQSLDSNTQSSLTTRSRPGYMQHLVAGASVSRAPVRRATKATEDRYCSQSALDPAHHSPVPAVPHDRYPLDGMTRLCRPGPPSERISQPTSARPSSRDSNSDCSNSTFFSSQEPPSGKMLPEQADKTVLRNKSGSEFVNNSPFRRKSNRAIKNGQAAVQNTWHSSSASKDPQCLRHPWREHQAEEINLLPDQYRTPSPQPIDANASLALNIGHNVFPVSTKIKSKTLTQAPEDPIALALAELKDVTVDKQSPVRMSADHYHGIATPAPVIQSQVRQAPVQAAKLGLRATPPPSYDTQIQRLGVPKPAVTSKAMQETSKRYTQQSHEMFKSTPRRHSPGYGSQSDRRIGSDAGGTYIDGTVSRPKSSNNGRPMSRPLTKESDVPRATSPAKPRSASPRPVMRHNQRSVSPNPSRGQSQHHRTSSQASANTDKEAYYSRHVSPHAMFPVALPSPRDPARSDSNQMNHDLVIELTPSPDDNYGSQRGRSLDRPGSSSSSTGMSLYEKPGTVIKSRSRSNVDPGRLYAGNGRLILHFARALYVYQAAIPEELGFNKGDILAILQHQDDGWWEAELYNASKKVGLVPSNYLQPC